MMGSLSIVAVVVLAYKFVFCICCIIIVLSKRHELLGEKRKRVSEERVSKD